MIFSSYSRIVHRAVALLAVVLLSACQSSGVTPPQGAALGTKSGPGAISKGACSCCSLAIIPINPKTHSRQKVALYAWIVTHWYGFRHHCMNGFYQHAPSATWQSNGGRFRPKHGFPVYFVDSKVGVYTIQAQDRYRGQTLDAKDTVTVQS